MATHSSIVAWSIPSTEEPGGLQSMGWQRVGPDCSNLTLSTHYIKEMKLWDSFQGIKIDRYLEDV